MWDRMWFRRSGETNIRKEAGQAGRKLWLLSYTTEASPQNIRLRRSPHGSSELRRVPHDGKGVQAVYQGHERHL